MFKNLTILLCILCFFVHEMKAQDIHFTSYDFSPLTLNPALAGSFSGTYRIGGIYRDQWRSAAAKGAYSTPTIHVDVPIIRGFRKQDWVGLGVGVFRDQSSQYRMVETKSFQGVSYHLALDKKQNRIISFGIQNGTGNRKLNLRQGRDLLTETLILGQTANNEIPTLDNQLITQEGTNTTDWVGGVMFSSYQRNLSFIRAGFSVGRINRDNQAFAKSFDRQKLKFTAFALYDTPIAGNLFLTPSLMYQRTGNNWETVAQVKTSYLISEAKNIYVNGGLGYRVGDAVQFLLGVDIKDTKVQLAYDLTASGYTAATNSVGAFELAVSYVGKVYKKPKIDPTEICPRL